MDRKKIDALSAALAAVIVEAIQGAVSRTTAAPAAAETTEAPRRTRKGAAKPPEVTLEQVRAALIALNEAKDKQAVVEVLSRFGVAKIGDLPPENYAEAKELAEAEAADESDGEDGEGDDPFGE